MQINNETKILLGILIGSLILIIAGAFLFSRPQKALTCSELIDSETHVIGDTKSSVCLVEFSDFQCPTCRDAQPIINELIKQYGDQFVFAYRHYPLGQHPLARKAAYAAEAAGKQGKFWEMHDALFEHQNELSEAKINELAQNIGLTMETFAQDINDNAIAQKVQKDYSFGSQLGINATPTFFLNGVKVELTSLNVLKAAVKKAVEEKNSFN